MLYLDIKGRPLLLPAGSTAQVEHVNPLFADGLEESYSLPVEVPVEGNAEVLGHVEELALVRRHLKLEQATLGHMGMALFPGVLHVLGSNRRAVRTTFSVDGFLQEIRGRRLPETLEGTAFDMFQTYYHFEDIPDYAQGGPCHFPMYYNPGLYGTANEDWVPSGVTDWDADSTYTINKFVRYRENYGLGVERNDIWQCTADTAAGESPYTHESKWRRAAFGIVNAWDAENDGYHYNSSDGNFYAFVPWFYLKWILTKSLEHLGYRVEGDFMQDERTHQVAVPNNTTLDRVAPEAPPSFFKVAQNAPKYWTTGVGANPEHYALPAQLDSSGILQDPSDVWNTSTFVFSPNAAGVWRINVRTGWVRPSAFHNWFTCSIREYGAPDVIRAQVLSPYNDPFDGWQSQNFDLVVEFSPADVGQPFFISLYGLEEQPGGVGGPNDTTIYIYWPKTSDDTVQETVITGYLEDPTPPISTPDNMIYPHRHVPDMEVKDFLIAISDAYNLRIAPDVVNKVVYLDYREDVLRTLNQNRTDQSTRQVNEPELDHTRNTSGITLQWDIERYDKKLEQQPQQYGSEVDIPPPISSGQLAFSQGTRMLYRSLVRPSDTNFTYVPLGYLVPPVTVGDPVDARVIQPAAKPLHMVHRKLAGEDYLMPELDALGTSTWFHTTGDDSALYLCEIAPGRSHSGSVTNVPSARSWGYGWNTDERSATTLLWNNADALLPGMYQQHWNNWLAMLTTAEAVTMDLQVDLPYLIGGRWKQVQHIHGQDYLIEKLPVEYGGTRGQLISKGAYLLRLRQPLEVSLVIPPEPVFLCSGPGYVSMYINTSESPGNVYILTDSGHCTIRMPDGTSLTIIGAATIELADSGSYCMWASDEDGNLAGGITEFFTWQAVESINIDGLDDNNATVFFGVAYAQISELALPDLPFLSGLGISSNVSLTGLSLPDYHALEYLELYDNSFTQETVDAILLNLVEHNIDNGFIVLTGVGNAPPSATGLGYKATLEGRGWTVLVNT